MGQYIRALPLAVLVLSVILSAGCMGGSAGVNTPAASPQTTTPLPSSAAPETATPAPGATEPVLPAPASTETASPSAATPEPTVPSPAVPTPSAPAPSEPTPSAPAPSEPTPSALAPGEPTPSAPAPGEPKPAAPSSAVPAPATSAHGEPKPISPSPASLEQSLKDKAEEIVEILRNRDLGGLRGMIHPDTGLTFSPYSYIDQEMALKFGPEDLPGFQDNVKRIWGAYDGTGDPMELTFQEYCEKFVYDRDFASAPEISVNMLKGTGNSIFNAQEIFPGASYVEFHFPGFDKQYEGMDWESLILVMLPEGQDWKLCAIVHASWTI